MKTRNDRYYLVFNTDFESYDTEKEALARIEEFIDLDSWCATNGDNALIKGVKLIVKSKTTVSIEKE